MEIRKRILAIQERIQRAAERAGRNPSEVTLVLVSKNVSTELIREAFEAGVSDFGENRVQEFVAKKSELPAEIRWHFVGTLQTNKIKFILGETALLHSLDRIELAQDLEKQAERKGLTADALVQVNTSGETTKSGFQPEAVEKALQKLSAYNRIHLQGLMTIGPLTENEKAVRESFRRLRELRDRLKVQFPQLNLRHLSMGMSSDFEIAIEEGATIVRVGTAVFGERK